MPRKQLQARFDPDVVDAVEQYGDEHDVSRSEAMRRMLRAGLSQNGYEVAVADGMGTATDDLTERLDTIEQRQAERHAELQSFRRSHDIGLLAVLAYVVATVTLQPQAVVGPALWAAFGVLALVGFGLSSWAYGKVVA